MVWALLSLRTRGAERGFREVAADEYFTGPCLAIEARHFEAVGGFDERFFLYREEETLARRLKEIGVTSYVDPQVRLLHVGGVSTSQVAEFSFRQFVRSTALFSAVHFPKPAAALVGVALLVRMLLGTPLAPVLRILRIRRGKASSWFARASPEVIRGLRAHPVTPPNSHEL